jgi:hypothetical protein
MQIPADPRPEIFALFSWPSSGVDRLLRVVFAAAFLASLAVLALTASQPIIESYGFRQAQTAVTSYWFVREGYALIYQTPVVGYPWPIPFELPLYQAIVAFVAAHTSWPLDNVGRAVSFAFFLGTLAPAAVICRRLQLSPRMFFLFGSLYLLSPVDLFWGRTFMIESTATFFAVATISATLPFFAPRAVSLPRLAGVLALASLATTVKVTTGLPVLGVLMAALGLCALEHWRKDDMTLAKTFFVRAALLAVPVALAFAWTYYTDVVKTHNEIGKLLTSAALPQWGFGTLHQRFSRVFLVEVLWRRCVEGNAGGVLGLAVMGFFLIDQARGRRLWIGLAVLALFALPLLVFTNLHIVHTYYQSANIVFLVFLLALALLSIGERVSHCLLIIAFLLVLGCDVGNFYTGYWRLASRDISAENNAVMAAAKVVREQAPRDHPIIVYGLDWSSELPYYAERKALAVPDWYPNYEDPLTHPERYLGSNPVGALVACAGRRAPVEEKLQRFLAARGPFRETSTPGCRIFVAAK